MRMWGSVRDLPVRWRKFFARPGPTHLAFVSYLSRVNMVRSLVSTCGGGYSQSLRMHFTRVKPTPWLDACRHCTGSALESLGHGAGSLAGGEATAAITICFVVARQI